MVGAVVCDKHGGMARQVRAKAEERVSLAEALAQGRPRPAWEVLADALHTTDVLARQVRDQALTSPTSPKLVLELVTSAERAARLAKTVLDANVDQRRQGLAEAQAGQMLHVFSAILNALELTPQQRALVPALVQREVRAAIEGRVSDASK